MAGVVEGVVQGVLAVLGSNAQVSVAAVTGLQLINAADAQQPTRYNANAGLYTEYELQAYYEDKQNILQLANATPAGGSLNASIVQWANPTMMMVLDFVGKQVGDWPDAPEKQSQDSNLVYMYGQVWPEPPNIRGDGNGLEYTIRGRYRYAVINPNEIVYRTGLYPWMDQSVADDSTMPTSVFSDDIMFPSGGTTASDPYDSVQQVQGELENIKQ